MCEISCEPRVMPGATKAGVLPLYVLEIQTMTAYIHFSRSAMQTLFGST